MGTVPPACRRTAPPISLYEPEVLLCTPRFPTPQTPPHHSYWLSLWPSLLALACGGTGQDLGSRPHQGLTRGLPPASATRASLSLVSTELFILSPEGEAMSLHLLPAHTLREPCQGRTEVLWRILRACG